MTDILESLVSTIFWVAIFFLVLQHVLGPVLVWRAERIPAAYDLQPIDIQSVMAELDQNGKLSVEQLVALGFVPVLASQIVKSHSRTSFLMFRHPTDPAAANLTTAANAALRVSYVEFTQVFTGNTMLDVNTSAMPSAFPAFPGKHVWRFPGMQVPELHTAFVKLRARHERTNSPLPSLSTEAPLADLSRRLDEETAKLMDAGYLVRRVENGAHRLTPKGAILFTWKFVWPWKPLRNKLQLAAARRALDAAHS